MKVVINKCYGGFSLSREAVEALAKKKGLALTWKGETFGEMAYTSPGCEDSTYFTSRPMDRTDPDLVAVVEEMGRAANGRLAELHIVEIPDGVEWEVEEYDGKEWVAERHRIWS